MSTKPIENKEPIDGEIYCNLRSTFPYNFVDQHGALVGSVGYVSTSVAKTLRLRIVRREVSPVEVAMTFPDYEPVTKMRFFIMEKRLTDDLKRHIVHCQNKARITRIIVDGDVLEAARIEASKDPSFTLRKFFLPMIHNAPLHRFYKWGVAGMIRIAVKNQLIVDNSSQYDLDHVDLR